MKITDIKIGLEKWEGRQSITCRIETDDPRTLACAMPWPAPQDKEAVALTLRIFATTIEATRNGIDVARAT